MSCIKTDVQKNESISSIAKKTSRIDSSATMSNRIQSLAQIQKGIETQPTRFGSIFCRVFQTCTTNIRRNYLEIEPKIVWILAGETQNSVFSNTQWNVD